MKWTKVLICGIFITISYMMVFFLKESSDSALLNQIENGDFSCVKNCEGVSVSEIERIYIKMQEKNNVQWIETDINKDGKSDLILQEKAGNSEGVNKIVGIFDIDKRNIKCVLWDVNDATEFSFLGKTNNVIYYTQYSGVFDYVCLDCYTFNQCWDKTYAYGIQAFNIYDAVEIPEGWFGDKCPDKLSIGENYIKYNYNQKMEILTKKEFEMEYENMTGLYFESSLFWGY